MKIHQTDIALGIALGLTASAGLYVKYRSHFRPEAEQAQEVLVPIAEARVAQSKMYLSRDRVLAAVRMEADTDHNGSVNLTEAREFTRRFLEKKDRPRGN